MHVPAYRKTDIYTHTKFNKKNLFKKDREGMVAHTFNYSTQEAGASSRPAYFIISSGQLEPQNSVSKYTDRKNSFPRKSHSKDGKKMQTLDLKMDRKAPRKRR